MRYHDSRRIHQTIANFPQECSHSGSRVFFSNYSVEIRVIFTWAEAADSRGRNENSGPSFWLPMYITSRVLAALLGYHVACSCGETFSTHSLKLIRLSWYIHLCPSIATCQDFACLFLASSYTASPQRTCLFPQHQPAPATVQTLQSVKHQ